METLADSYTALNYYEYPRVCNSAIDEEMQEKIFRVILDIICNTTERYPLSWELPQSDVLCALDVPGERLVPRQSLGTHYPAHR